MKELFVSLNPALISTGYEPGQHLAAGFPSRDWILRYSMSGNASSPVDSAGGPASPESTAASGALKVDGVYVKSYLER